MRSHYDVLTINCESLNMSDEQFYQLCQDNRDLRLEKNKYGDMVIMPPTGGETGRKNAKIVQQLSNWIDDNSGVCFDSSTGFRLNNGEVRSPDVAWITTEKWDSLTSEEKERFIPLSPDFVIELRSKNDNLKSLQGKMKEYLDNGTQLGWLINPQDRQVEIYRQGKEVEILINPLALSGENILPNFTLNLEVIW